MSRGYAERVHVCRHLGVSETGKCPNCDMWIIANPGLPLFDPPSVAVPASEDAADQIKPHVTNLRRRVLAAVGASPFGLTCDSLCDMLKLDGNTVRPRLWELEGAGLVHKSKTAWAATRSGRAAHSYSVTEAGRQALRTAR